MDVSLPSGQWSQTVWSDAETTAATKHRTTKHFIFVVINYTPNAKNNNTVEGVTACSEVLEN